jgi:hypothetical protein
MQVFAARLPVARVLHAAPRRASAARAAPRAARRGMRVRAEAVEEEANAMRGAEDSIGMGVMEDIMKSAAGAWRIAFVASVVVAHALAHCRRRRRARLGAGHPRA